ENGAVVSLRGVAGPSSQLPACVRACVRVCVTQRTGEIHYLSSTMDIYHPVVLFKFSTKRRLSPVLSPPSYRSRSIYCCRRCRETRIRTVCQSVRARKGWVERRQERLSGEYEACWLRSF
ncbi:hypothetical protein XENOCAPTIV_012776, partial [Xenoophorus captivus]